MLREFQMSDYLQRTVDENNKRAHKMSVCALGVLLAGIIAGVFISPALSLIATGALWPAVKASNARMRNGILRLGIEGELALHA